MEDPDGNIVTQIRRIIRSDVNFDKLDYLNDLSRYICRERPDVPIIREKFDNVMSRRDYPTWIAYLGAALIAGGFAVFFGGSFEDGGASAVLGVVMLAMIKFMSRYEKNQLAMMFIISFLSGLFTILMMTTGLGSMMGNVLGGVLQDMFGLNAMLLFVTVSTIIGIIIMVTVCLIQIRRNVNNHSAENA